MMDGNHSTPELESLLAWAKSNGGFIDNRLVLLSGKKSGSTCYTTATIPPSTRLLTIPHTLVISYSRAQSELPIQLSQNEPPVNHFSVLSAFLALEQLKGTESFWYPYIATLPSIEQGCGGPMFQTNDTIDIWLGGTNLGVSMVDNIKEDWRQDWKCIKELLRSIEGWEAKAESLTWKLYLWAASMFASRAFPDKLLSWDKKTPTTLSAPQLGAQTNTDGTIQYIQSGVANGSKPALFPLLDILNHKPRTKITWNPGENEIGFTGEEFLDKGVEVFNNYGPKSNQQLLLSYGFTIRDNPDDAVMLKFKPALDPVRQAIRDKQISQKDDVGIYHLMASDPTLPRELIQLFRLIVANQWELEALFESPTNPIIGRNELAAKTQILKSLNMKRQSHCRIYPDADRGYDEDPQFNSYATIFKEGQIMILDSAISILQNELRELYSRCILISVDDLIASSRDFQTAICTCFGDEEYQAESGMDQVSAILAICNLRRIYEKGKKCPENQAKELIQRYPMDAWESEEEDARVCELYDQIFPAAAEAVPHFFGDKRWTLDLIRWGSRVYQGEIVTLFVDGGELQKDYLVFSRGQGLQEDSSG